MDNGPFNTEPLRSIDLDALDASAALWTRFDQKYLLDDRHLAALVPVVLGAHHDWRVLTIDGETEFAYSTNYFDRDLMTYHHHQQGRRRRFKVRSRSYSTASTPSLEVKTKDGRGRTDKRRRHRSCDGATLAPDEIVWVNGELASVGIQPIDETLEASLAISYRRTTLVNATGGERLTIDRAIVATPIGAGGLLGEPSPVLPNGVILEVKANRPRSAVTRRLLHQRHRPMRLSKYCLGVASADPNLDRGMLSAALREAGRLARRLD